MSAAATAVEASTAALIVAFVRPTDQLTNQRDKSDCFCREWILTKIVNGERASYSAPKFARMQERTRSQMLEDIVANLANHAETGQIPKPYRRGSWRPIGEDLCMLRATISCCIQFNFPHSMYSIYSKYKHPLLHSTPVRPPH